MTTEIDPEQRLNEILAGVRRLAEKARHRALQIEGYFRHRADSSGMLEALASVRGSVLRELAEDEIYRVMLGEVAKAAELAGESRLDPRGEFAVVRRFVERLGSASRRRIETESTSFMANRRAVERHNALLRVLEELEARIDEGRPLAR